MHPFVKEICSWLQKQFMTRTREGRCVNIELCHVKADTKTKAPVEAWEPWEDERDGRYKDPETLAADIASAAQRDADGQGGMQNYVLLGYFEMKPEIAVTRLPLRVLGADEMETAGNMIPSEPPTRDGITSQLMRHNEHVMRSSALTQGKLFTHFERTIERQQLRIALLEDKLADAITAREEYISKTHERNIELYQVQTGEKRKDEIFDKINILVPTFVNHMAGKKLLPENSHPVVEVLRSVFESLKPEQMAVLEKIFTKEQMLGLLQAYKAFQTDEQAKTDTKEKGIALIRSGAFAKAGGSGEGAA